MTSPPAKSTNSAGILALAACRSPVGMSIGWTSTTTNSTASPAAAISGRYHHCATSVNRAMRNGESAVPNPSSTFSAVRATSRRSGMKAPAYVLMEPRVRPNPRPKDAVATSSIAYTPASCSTATLPTSRAMASVSASTPASSTRFKVKRREKVGRPRDPTMAMTTWGRKRMPYRLLDRS